MKKTETIKWGASESVYGKRHYSAEGRGFSLRIDPVFNFESTKEVFKGYRVSGNYHGNGWKIILQSTKKLSDAKKAAARWISGQAKNPARGTRKFKGSRELTAAVLTNRHPARRGGDSSIKRQEKQQWKTIDALDRAEKRLKAKRKRNTTIIKAKKIGKVIIRKRPSVANPYAYQVQFQWPGEKVQYAGAYYTSSRADALKQAEMDLKRRKLWKPKTKLITGAVPLNSTAARHKNAKTSDKHFYVYAQQKTGNKSPFLIGKFWARSKPSAIKQAKSFYKTDYGHPLNLLENWQALNAPIRRAINPASSKVRQLRESFTGLKSRQTAMMNAPKGTPANLAKLGKLISIKAAKGTIRPGRRNPSSTVWLCADARGKLHLCTTGDRLIDGPAQSFGEIREIEYEAIKPHLGHARPTIFFHKMAEEGGNRPELRADGAGGLKITGGTYYITPEGIRD